MKLNAAMFKMDTGVVSCQSRVMKLLKDFDQILVKFSMEGFQEREPKTTQEWLINALQPPTLK